MDENTGPGQETTPADGGVGGNAQDPKPAAGAPAPTAGGDQAQALQAQLEEQRKIQQGLDKRIAQLNQQLAVEQQAKAELARQLEAIQGKNDGEAQELELLRQKVTAYDAEKADLDAQLAAVRDEAERVKLVAAKYPALAPLVEAGALPQADSMEDFEAKLGAMAQAFNAQAVTQLQELAAGAKPPASPASGGEVDRDALHRDMLAALRENDMTKYNELREQWYAASEGFFN